MNPGSQVHPTMQCTHPKARQECEQRQENTDQPSLIEYNAHLSHSQLGSLTAEALLRQHRGFFFFTDTRKVDNLIYAYLIEAVGCPESRF